MKAAVEEIRIIFEQFGLVHYESGVSHLEHALQTAFLAEHSDATTSLISAALLHDLGQILIKNSPNPAAGEVPKHELVGGNWLSTRFDASVVGPARLHVEAKRYLCALDPAFIRRLSADSLTSLELQGGPFSTQESETFLQQKFAGDALRLREWDDAAKVPGRKTPDLSHFLVLAQRHAL
jgi:predicted HD phosphohydrolase